MRAQIVVYDGFDETDAIAPYEVLRNARAAGADLQVELAVLGSPRQVVAGRGLAIQPQAMLGGSVDLLIVPGGGWGSRAEHGAWAEYQRGELPAAIARLHAAGTVVASVCTGAMLLAKAGITNGRPTTTHRVAVEDLRASGATVVRARVVDDGDLITAGGVTSGFDLALWLVEREFGPQMAAKIEHELEYERRGVVWRSQQGGVLPR